MKFQSKLSNIKIGGKKPDKQENEKKILRIFIMQEMRLSNFIMIIL